MHRRDLQIVACDVLNGFHLAAMWCTPDSAFGHLAAGAGRAGRAARTNAPVPAAARWQAVKVAPAVCVGSCGAFATCAAPGSLLVCTCGDGVRPPSTPAAGTPQAAPRTVCANDQLRDPQRERRRGTEGAGEPPGDWSWHAPDRGWLKGQALCSCFAGSLVSAPTLVWLISPLPLAVWGDKVLTDGTVGTVVRLVRAFEPGL